MATVSVQNSPKLQKNSAVDQYFFTVFATSMIVVSLAGFVPSLANPAGRRAPLTLLAAAHGIVFLAWLVLFVVQSRLVATRRIVTHRRLGIAGIFLLLLMIPLGYWSTISMVRRGFDLSADLKPRRIELASTPRRMRVSRRTRPHCRPVSIATQHETARAGGDFGNRTADC